MSQQIDRTLDVLELHAGNPDGFPLSETAIRLGISKGAAHRVLTQLVQRGYLEQDPISQRYRLTLRLVALGFQHLTNTGLTDICQPELDKMAELTGELVRLTMVDGDSLIWAAQAQGAKHGLRYDGNFGRTVNLTATATGKSWLATMEERRVRAIVEDQGFGDPTEVGPCALRDTAIVLKEIAKTRIRGFGLAYEEGEPGMCAVAAAIPGNADDAPFVGTVSVAAPTVRTPLEKLEAWAPNVVDLANRLSKLWPIRAFQPAATTRLSA
ncbi:MAG: IclR family transcriptional regulator [Geminicoccaceae bacterium]